MHTVPADLEGQRLSVFLRETMQMSFTAMKSAKWANRICVNGEPTPVNYRLHAGDEVQVLEEKAAPVYQLRPYDLPLTFAFTDPHYYVIDKPAPLASQSSAGHPDNSLENALFSFEGCPPGFIYRPVNRLDKGTSGLMLVARTAHAQHVAQKWLHTDHFKRTYLAVCEGAPDEDEGVIDLPIAKENAASIRRIVTAEGKPSVTHFQVLSRGRRSLIRLQLETGRTHQIRVHLSALGCPIVGDFLYGREDTALPGRFALHSAELHFDHPISGESLHCISPMPEAFARLY